MKFAATLFALLGFGLSAVAQQPSLSPKVNPDRTVTFRFSAPRAEKVEFSSQFTQGQLPMNKGANGVWEITVGPAKPDIYPYNFVVDGVQVADPTNTDLFPNENFKASVIDIPSDEPSYYSLSDVPHGQVRYCNYYSKTLKQMRPLLVYTPAGYDKGNKSYPVFYLISGTTDTEETWFKVGKANLIADNLIAEGKAVPMIIVMPYGNMGWTPNPMSAESADMYKVFDSELTGDIMPFVESNFRTSARRTERAIAGFSRGGGQSLFVGFNNLDKFSHICSFSAYLTKEVFDKYYGDLLKDPKALNDRLDLLWSGVGSSDFLHNQSVDFVKMMRDNGIECIDLGTEGGHTWMNARRYLFETLQLVFKR